MSPRQKNKVLTRFFKIFILLSLSLGVLTCISSQHVLDSVIIKGARNYTFDIVKPSHEKKDSNRLDLKTTDFLQNITSGQLQISTPGGLHTFLHRGMATRHLPVLWSGINIQSVVNGTFDYNLIPISLMGEVNFYTFGSPTLTGNNSLAGAITFDKKKKLDKIEVSTSLSSLQNYMISFLTELKTGKMIHQFGTSYTFEKNIFPYKDGKDIKKRTSTDFHNRNIVYRNQFSINSHNMLELDFWWQNAYRYIPVSISSAPIEQLQKDRNLRVHLNHKYFKAGYKVSTSIYYMKEGLDYRTTSIDSRAEVDIYQGGIEITENKKNDHHIFVKYRKDVASPNFYTDLKSRNTLNLGASKKIVFGKALVSQLSIRQDLVDNNLMPLSGSLLINYKKISMNLARNYNLPGLNDLYWPSGGNINLKTEKIVQAELATSFEWEGISLNGKTYYNLINDWIQWIPGINGIFSPVNQKRVRSTGLEIGLRKVYPFKDFQLMTSLEYALNSTSAIEHYTNADQIGKQLIYVPKHKLNAAASIQMKYFETALTYRLTGKRYDAPDHSQSLPVNHIMDLNVGYAYKTWRWQINVLNLLSEDYSIVRFFPLPRRHFILSVKYTLS